jgi:hypothetical protein
MAIDINMAFAEGSTCTTLERLVSRRYLVTVQRCMVDLMIQFARYEAIVAG